MGRSKMQRVACWICEHDERRLFRVLVHGTPSPEPHEFSCCLREVVDVDLRGASAGVVYARWERPSFGTSPSEVLPGASPGPSFGRVLGQYSRITVDHRPLAKPSRWRVAEPPLPPRPV